MQEKYLRSIGSLEHMRIDFKFASDEYRERKKEKYPYKTGERDRHIREIALLKGMSSEELTKHMTVNRGI